MREVERGRFFVTVMWCWSACSLCGPVLLLNFYKNTPTSIDSSRYMCDSKIQHFVCSAYCPSRRRIDSQFMTAHRINRIRFRWSKKTKKGETRARSPKEYAKNNTKIENKKNKDFFRCRRNHVPNFQQYKLHFRFISGNIGCLRPVWREFGNLIRVYRSSILMSFKRAQWHFPSRNSAEHCQCQWMKRLFCWFCWFRPLLSLSRQPTADIWSHIQYDNDIKSDSIKTQLNKEVNESETHVHTHAKMVF